MILGSGLTLQDVGEGCHHCGAHAKFATSKLPLAAYDTGAGASDPKTNKQQITLAKQLTCTADGSIARSWQLHGLTVPAKESEILGT